MPMRLAGRNMHDIAHHQPSRLLSFTTDQSSPHRHGENLSALVRVPERAGAGREADVVGHAVGGAEDGIHVYDAGEGRGGLFGGGVGCVGGAY